VASNHIVFIVMDSCRYDSMIAAATPNIDRIGKEGALFTDWYGQQSCTAGRAASSTASPAARSPTRAR
jgi:arylsulfatase